MKVKKVGNLPEQLGGVGIAKWKKTALQRKTVRIKKDDLIQKKKTTRKMTDWLVRSDVKNKKNTITADKTMTRDQNCVTEIDRGVGNVFSGGDEPHPNLNVTNFYIMEKEKQERQEKARRRHLDWWKEITINMVMEGLLETAWKELLLNKELEGIRRMEKKVKARKLQEKWWKDYTVNGIVSGVVDDTWKKIMETEEDRKKEKQQEASRKKEIWIIEYRQKIMRLETEHVVDLAWKLVNMDSEIARWRLEPGRPPL